MPSSAAAIRLFHDARVLFAPGKAATPAGVATSGLEMSQNAQRLSGPGRRWTPASRIMTSIHATTCVRYGQDDGHVELRKAAPILPASSGG